MSIRRVVGAVMLLAVTAILAGCAQEAQVNRVEEQNKAVVRRVHAEVSKGNIAVFDEVLAPDYVRHCQAMPAGLQELHGTEQFLKFIEEFMVAVPDCHDSVGVVIAEGNMVAYYTIMTGTQTGPMGDLPASGREFTLTNLVMHRFENGKIAETWVSWDNVAMLSQLGFFPPPPPSSEEP